MNNRENTDKLINEIIPLSFQKARNIPVEDKNKGHRNHLRSSNWVKSLACQFRRKYKYQNIVVFSRDCDDNRNDLGINEFLYDILVCKTGYVESARQHRQLQYLKEAIWMVESELKKDTRQAIHDFSKLIIGSAHNKLFVGPQVYDNESYLATIGKIAKDCPGNLYTALIPHPDEWDRTESKIDIFKFQNGNWISLNVNM
jgi:hypothetical protein